MKKLLTVILSLSLLGAAALPALAADSEPPMVISPALEEIVSSDQGEDLAASGFSVEIDGSRIDASACVMVPLRSVAEKMGFIVAWDNNVITVTGPERYVRLTVGTNEYFAAPTQEGMMGASLFSLGCAPYMINGSTYVPVELFDALLGCKEGTVTLEGNAVKISTDDSSANTAQLPNPFIDHGTLAEAVKAAGFDLTVPEKINDSPRQTIQTMDGGMIQVFYGGEDNAVCIRKAPGSEDISGDYNSYAQVSTVDVDGVRVIMKEENDLIRLAIWTNAGYTYSISAQDGMNRDDMSALVRLVK